MDFVATDPLQRLVRTSTESLAAAMRSRRPVESAAVSQECDARRCRMVLDAARREIERLRDRLVFAEQDRLARNRGEESAPDPLSAPPTERKAYAPDPPGKTPEHRDVTPPDPAELVRVLNYFHITNVATLLDVLA